MYEDKINNKSVSLCIMCCYNMKIRYSLMNVKKINYLSKNNNSNFRNSTRKTIKEANRLWLSKQQSQSNKQTNQPNQTSIKIRQSLRNRALLVQTEREKQGIQRETNGVQQLDGALGGARVRRRMAVHSVHARAADQPAAVGSHLLLPIAAIGSPRSLPLDFPLPPSSWSLLLLLFLLFRRRRLWWIFL